MTAKYNAKPDPTKRPPGAPLTDAEKKQIGELLAAGKTHREICDTVGIGTSTLSRYKKLNGLTTPVITDNRPATQAFSRAAAAKRAERVAYLDELFENRAEMLRKVQRGEADYKTILKGAMGVEQVTSLDFIPAPDWRSEISALSGIANAIDRVDDRADDGGLARAQSMLDAVLKAALGQKIDIEPGVINE